MQLESERLAHANLICGALGTGKNILANAFAKYVMCSSSEKGITCGNCRNCLLEQGSGHPDIIRIGVEEGKKDISIEQIRSLSAFFLKTSHGRRAKIALITDAHHMNTSAANALLKTLEEPTPSSYLFLVTHLPGSLPATIRSRCQKLTMPTPTKEEAKTWLRQHAPDQEDPKSLLIAARNCPLLALELVTSGILDNERQFLKKLVQLAEGETSIQTTVKLATKLEQAKVIRYLLEVSTMLVRYLLIDQQPRGFRSEHTDLFELFRINHQPAQQMQILRNLIDFYDMVMESQKNLLSKANPNSQLILESLLWRWSQLRVLQ
tara:strand:- start:365 stop:1327 length:963 start_codon:yes stop_codon:yes gene_type:complete